MCKVSTLRSTVYAFSCAKPMATREKLLSRSSEDASCIPLNVTAFARSSPSPVSRVSILFASRAASSNGTNSVSGSPNVRVYSIWGKPTISMPADPPLRCRRARRVLFRAQILLSPFLFLVRCAGLIRPSGTTLLALQRRLQAYGPNHWCFIVEPTRDAQILALAFHFGREPFCANDRAAASIE
jgi:hypothetical protein